MHTNQRQEIESKWSVARLQRSVGQPFKHTLSLSNPASSKAEKASADNTSAHCKKDLPLNIMPKGDKMRKKTKYTLQSNFLILLMSETWKKKHRELCKLKPERVWTFRRLTFKSHMESLQKDPIKAGEESF